MAEGVELKPGTSIKDAPVVRPAPSSVQVGKSDLEILADATSHQKPSVGGDNVTDSCQPSTAVDFGTVIGKEPPCKGPSDVPDGPTPVFDELRDPQVDNPEEAETGSSEFDENNLNVQPLTQTADADISTQDTIAESTGEPNNESGQIPDGDSCKPSQSLVNLSSYVDLQEESNTEPIAGSIKEQHYNQEQEEPRPIQPQSGNARLNSSTVVPSGDLLSEGPSRSKGRLNDNSTAITQVGQDQEATPTIPLPPRTTANKQELPIPAKLIYQRAPPSQPGTSTAAELVPDQLAALGTSDDDVFFKEHFDVCVIYTQQYRSRADEIVKYIKSLPEKYNVCYYDDDEFFGLFPRESHTGVLDDHCFLHLIVISDNLEEDKDDANAIRKTITVLNKNNAKIRAVLFTEADVKYIPKSLANFKRVAWYHWHDKGKEHLKANFDALLLQCKALRKRKESQNVRTKKHVD